MVVGAGELRLKKLGMFNLEKIPAGKEKELYFGAPKDRTK